MRESMRFVVTGCWKTDFYEGECNNLQVVTRGNVYSLIFKEIGLEIILNKETFSYIYNLIETILK